LITLGLGLRFEACVLNLSYQGLGFSTCVVAVVVGNMAYGSTAGSLQWYGWLASTGIASCSRRTRQTDRKVSGLAKHLHSVLVLDNVTETHSGLTEHATMHRGRCYSSLGDCFVPIPEVDLRARREKVRAGQQHRLPPSAYSSSRPSSGPGRFTWRCQHRGSPHRCTPLELPTGATKPHGCTSRGSCPHGSARRCLPCGRRTR